MSLSSCVPIAYRKERVAPRLRTFAACLFGVMLVLGCGLRQTHAQAKAQAPKELRVAAASDLQPIMPVFADAYLKAKGVKLVISYGSSATLATQIQNGAPMDIFLAADYSFPEQLVAAGLTDAKAPTPYAKGTLVLWARKDSPLQPLNGNTLSDPRITSLAIADEFHAPYGRAAVAALKRMKVYDTLKPHLVIGENITQTGQYVESGNAQLGLISLTMASTAHFKEIGSYVQIPTTTYPPINQCAVVMAKSDRKAEAHDFLDWILSPEVQVKLQDFGLTPAIASSNQQRKKSLY